MIMNIYIYTYIIYFKILSSNSHTKKLQQISQLPERNRFSCSPSSLEVSGDGYLEDHPSWAVRITPIYKPFRPSRPFGRGTTPL